MNLCFFFNFPLFVFSANERYKHINLLNIFISATLFWVHATVSFFSSLADVAAATVVYGWERRW